MVHNTFFALLIERITEDKRKASKLLGVMTPTDPAGLKNLSYTIARHYAEKEVISESEIDIYARSWAVAWYKKVAIKLSKW